MFNKPAVSAIFLAMALFSAFCHAGAVDPQASGVTSPELITEKTVVLLRHGARAELERGLLNLYSSRQWPSFGVEGGHLLARGATAITLFGDHLRAKFVADGLIPANGCPTADDVFLVASPRQRTIATANAFAKGLFPTCVPLTVNVAPKNMFFPIAGPLDAETLRLAEIAVTEASGMTLAELQRHYQADIKTIEALAGLPDRCKPYAPGSHTDCLSNMPWKINANDANIIISPLYIIDTMASTMQMQYAGNMPPEQLAFGQVTDLAALSRLMKLRRTMYDLTIRPPFFIKQHASTLTREMLSALGQVRPKSGINARPASKLTIFVAHDSSIGAMQGLLGFDWQIPGHVQGDINPGGALLIEQLLNTRTKARYIRISHQAQTLDQIRSLIPLGADAMPFRVEFVPSAKFHALPGNLIPLNKFVEIVDDMLDGTAEQSVEYAPIVPMAPKAVGAVLTAAKSLDFDLGT